MRSSRTPSPSETGQRARAGIEALGSAAPHPNNHRAGMVMSDKQVSRALFDLEKDEQVAAYASHCGSRSRSLAPTCGIRC